MPYRIFAPIAFAALLMSGCGAGETTQDVPSATEAKPATTVEAPIANDIVAITRTGNAAGRTVVLIPGLASSAAVWDDTVHALDAEYDLRIVQVAGFAGAAPADSEGQYTDAIAEAIAKSLAEAPGQETVLVGHSLGGFVAMKTALMAPDVVEELIIVDSLPFLAGLFNPAATPELSATQGQFMATQMAALPRETFDAQQAAGVGRLVKTQDYAPTIIEWGKASDQATVAKAMGELIATDMRPALEKLTQETLIMMSWDAAMGAPQEQVLAIYEGQYAAAPNARIETIEGAFHFIMVDQTEVFLARLKAALAD